MPNCAGFKSQGFTESKAWSLLGVFEATLNIAVAHCRIIAWLRSATHLSRITMSMSSVCGYASVPRKPAKLLQKWKGRAVIQSVLDTSRHRFVWRTTLRTTNGCTAKNGSSVLGWMHRQRNVIPRSATALAHRQGDMSLPGLVVSFFVHILTEILLISSFATWCFIQRTWTVLLDLAFFQALYGL